MRRLMSKLPCIVTLAALTAATLALAQAAIPDLRGTWKGESESIVLGAGNPHHSGTAAQEPEFRSVPFTRSGSIFLADAEGFSHGTMLASDRMELCYLKHSAETRIASCVELAKQP
jgi:hypothetical protein